MEILVQEQTQSFCLLKIFVTLWKYMHTDYQFNNCCEMKAYF